MPKEDICGAANRRQSRRQSLVFALEWLGAGLEEWAQVYVVAGVIVLIGLGLRYFLAGEEDEEVSRHCHNQNS